MKKVQFCIPPERETKRVAVYEACIDALAHMTLEEGNRDKYRLSLWGESLLRKKNAQIQSERFKKAAGRTGRISEESSGNQRN